jgi:hypothetical protein
MPFGLQGGMNDQMIIVQKRDGNNGKTFLQE